jgi:hypothetical protein
LEGSLGYTRNKQTEWKPGLGHLCPEGQRRIRRYLNRSNQLEVLWATISKKKPLSRFSRMWMKWSTSCIHTLSRVQVWGEPALCGEIFLNFLRVLTVVLKECALSGMCSEVVAAQERACSLKVEHRPRQLADTHFPADTVSFFF